jgi:hypothetical protein
MRIAIDRTIADNLFTDNLQRTYPSLPRSVSSALGWV